MAKEPEWLEGIEGDDARRLITSDAPLIRVVAGPGSGKTTCLKRRTQRLIEGEAVDPEVVFVGTFTRAIARDLHDELGEQVGVSTLHSLAYRLLRDNPSARQGMELRFLLEYEEGVLLYDIADRVEQEDQWKRKKALRRLQSARSERQEFPDAAFAGAVRDWLRRHGGMLIGEVVYLAVTGLESHDIPPGQYDHVVVDEYQDLTVAEQELVELVWSHEGSLVVMGDNDQSIYAFRFNHPEGIEEFGQRWEDEDEDVIDLTFPANRRCGDEILKVANLMMVEAGSTKDPMVAASGRPGELSLIHWPSAKAEVNGLATYIGAKDDESFLVLVPRRFIGYRLREAIGEDARTAFRQEAVEYQLAQERFALASVLADPDDSVALRCWLALHGTRSKQAVKRNAPAYADLPTDISGLELARRVVSGDISVSGTGSQHLRRRAEDLLDLFDSGLAENAEQALKVAFDPSVADAEEDPEKREWIIDDLTALRDAGLQTLESLDEPSLQAVMSVLRYRIATRAPLVEEDDEPRVQIMTLYSAKGLEADNIVLAGIADQIVPGPTDDPDERAEQHRVLYVAVTRARNNLVVSWPQSVEYDRAASNHIRIDSAFTRNDVLHVELSRTGLLPQALPGGQRGSSWLQGSC